MAATVAQVARLRRMVAEQTSATYSDTDLAGYIEGCPLLDALGREPFIVSATSPPELEANEDWTPTYDLNAAAGEIWAEKVSALASQFDFSEDGQTFSRSQAVRHAQQQARYYTARRSASVIKLHPGGTITNNTIANGSECPC